MTHVCYELGVAITMVTCIALCHVKYCSTPAIKTCAMRIESEARCHVLAMPRLMHEPLQCKPPRTAGTVMVAVYAELAEAVLAVAVVHGNVDSMLAYTFVAACLCMLLR